GACSLVAFGAAVTLPLWMIALGPLLFGVPHVVADLRYVVVRPGYHRRLGLALSAVLGITASAFGLGLRGALLGGALALLFARGSVWRRATLLLLIGSAWYAVTLVGRFADLLLVHVHNAVAVAFLLLWRWPVRGARLALVAGWAALAALLLCGALDP